MKQYIVKVTEQALADMEEIYAYIADKLQAPDTAIRQYNRIAAEVESLRIFPERYKLFDSDPEREMGLRQLVAGNYSAIYVVADDVVTVLRVLYSSSNIVARLRGES